MGPAFRRAPTHGAARRLPHRGRYSSKHSPVPPSAPQFALPLGYPKPRQSLGARQAELRLLVSQQSDKKIAANIAKAARCVLCASRNQIIRIDSSAQRARCCRLLSAPSPHQKRSIQRRSAWLVTQGERWPKQGSFLYIAGAHNFGPAGDLAFDEGAELIWPHVFRYEALLV